MRCGDVSASSGSDWRAAAAAGVGHALQAPRAQFGFEMRRRIIQRSLHTRAGCTHPVVEFAPQGVQHVLISSVVVPVWSVNLASAVAVLTRSEFRLWPQDLEGDLRCGAAAVIRPPRMRYSRVP